MHKNFPKKYLDIKKWVIVLRYSLLNNITQIKISALISK